MLNSSTYCTSCSGLVMKLFHTTSMAIFTSSSSASGISLANLLLAAAPDLLVIFRLEDWSPCRAPAARSCRRTPGIAERRAQATSSPLARTAGSGSENRSSNEPNRPRRECRCPSCRAPNRFGYIDVARAIHLDALESQRLDRAKLVLDRAGDPIMPNLTAFFRRGFSSPPLPGAAGGRPGAERAGRNDRGCAGQELAAASCERAWQGSCDRGRISMGPRLTYTFASGEPKRNRQDEAEG